MQFDGVELDFYNECLSALKERHGDSKFYLAELEAYVFAVFQREALMESLKPKKIGSVDHTNKAGHTNKASDPDVRMFALYNEQAMKLSKALGLQLAAPKVGRKAKAKKGFILDGKMKVA
jgi:hypothetical protein